MPVKNFSIPKSAEDWNSIWMARQANRSINHSSEYWNKRAESFTNKDTPGSYTERFLELADIQPGETVFDMGCGTGNLSIPLGKEGHHVLAADFSRNMLKRLDEKLQSEDIHCVRTLELSWDDNWETAGVKHNSFDVCVASRSIATDDLLSAIEKLTSTAKRRACITLATGASPRIDDRILRCVGIETDPCLDDVYAIAILSALGYLPELTYIHTLRDDVFESQEAAFEKYSSMVKAELQKDLDKEAEVKIHQWLQENLTETKNGFELKEPRRVSWAFISWDI